MNRRREPEDVTRVTVEVIDVYAVDLMIDAVRRWWKRRRCEHVWISAHFGCRECARCDAFECIAGPR